MTNSFQSPSMINFSDLTFDIEPKKAQFYLSDYYQTIIACSSILLAYAYKMWPLWFVAGYIVLKNSLYWAATIAEKKRVDTTMNRQTFYLTESESNWREFWNTLSNVFRRMHRMVSSETNAPPPLFLSRSNTVCYGNEIRSASLGCVNIQEYHQIRKNHYRKYFTLVAVCILLISSFILYWVW